MKNILYSVLMLIAVMPALACGAFPCEDMVPTAAEAPCHDESENRQVPDGPMLFKDCSNLDLHYYQADKPIQEPVLKLLNYYVIFDTADSDYLAALLPSHNSRAPPNRLYAAPATALYLSTLRIRV